MTFATHFERLIDTSPMYLAMFRMLSNTIDAVNDSNNTPHCTIPLEFKL